MTKTKMTRKTLALRLFVVATLVNLLLLALFWPSSTPQKNTTRTPPPQHIEIKLKAILHTPFVAGKKVLLIPPSGQAIGAGLLLRQDEDGAVLWLSEELYRTHHRRLVQLEWSLVPHIDGIQRPLTHSGGHYEIAY